MQLLAHIFKRRNHGDREEVKIRLFNMDGSDYEGAGGVGGEGIWFFGLGSNQDFLEDNSGIGHVIPLTTFDALPDGVELVDGALHVPQGAYVLQLKAVWSNFDFDGAVSGHLNVRVRFVYGSGGSENYDQSMEIDQMAADGLKTDVEKVGLTITPDVGRFEVYVDQNLDNSEPELTPAIQFWLTLAKI